jgi:hypothetical protein
MPRSDGNRPQPGAGKRWTWLAAIASILLVAACGGGHDAVPSAAAFPQVTKTETFDAGTAFRGHGTWWNPAEPGTGFFVDAQLATAIVTFYVYDDAGQPTWVAAAGPFTQAGARFQFNGTLQRFEGGASIRTASPAFNAPTSTSVGNVSITFEGDQATVELPGRRFNAQKFFAGESSREASARAPETGIYWARNESGRGYTIEVNGGVASVGIYHYDAQTGAPTWNLAVAPLRSVLPALNTLPIQNYTGGQTLSGVYAGPPKQAAQGSFQLAFKSACAAEMRLLSLSNANTTLERFSFAGLSERDACRAWSTLPGALPTVYNTGVLPTMGNVSNRDLSVSFGFGLPDTQGLTAFADFSARAAHNVPANRSTHLKLLSGALPPGLSFDAATGELRGVPTAASESTLEVGLTVDGFGGQVADRQVLVVRAPVLSYQGHAGGSAPIWATSFEVDRLLLSPSQVLMLRDAATLQPMQTAGSVSVSYAVAEGSSLPPGLAFDPATNTLSGTPRVVADRHETIFEARLTVGGVTTRIQGMVPFRIQAPGAAASPGRIEYEALPVVTTEEALRQQFNEQGARGFRYLTQLSFQDARSAAVFVRDSNETFEYELLPAAADTLTLRAQLLGKSSAGYRWGALVGPGHAYSAFVRGSAQGRFDLEALIWATTPISELVTQANQQGALGYSYAGHRTFSSGIVSLHERDTVRPARYDYLASTEDPVSQTDFVARLNAHGARGYRLRPVEVPQTSVAPGTLPARRMLLERDSTQGASFHYSVQSTPANQSEFLERAAAEGRTGGVLAAAYLRLGLPGTLVYVRPLQCQGVICRASPLLPQ